jgi:SAM-dependent methyltransferase
MTRTKLFEQFLNFFWLRPESALLTALRADALQTTFEFFGKESRTIDVSCGDGVFSFLTMGGKLSPETDMFRSLNVESIFREGDEDHFDSYDEDYFVEVEKSPDRSYEYGSDWKPNLLSKANHLDFYTELIEHDNNDPLPFEDGSMSYVYNNSAYWVERFDFHLQDLVRITEPGGHVVLEMKTEAIKEYTSRNYAPFMGKRFHEIIDAGRLSTWRGLRSKSEILSTLEGLDDCHIQTVEPIYGGLPIQMWDIGLRPLFPPLSKLANGVTDEKRLEVKAEWCTIIYELLEHYLQRYEADEADAVEYMIVLEKE